MGELRCRSPLHDYHWFSLRGNGFFHPAKLISKDVEKWILHGIRLQLLCQFQLQEELLRYLKGMPVDEQAESFFFVQSAAFEYGKTKLSLFKQIYYHKNLLLKKLLNINIGLSKSSINRSDRLHSCQKHSHALFKRALLIVVNTASIAVWRDVTLGCRDLLAKLWTALQV